MKYTKTDGLAVVKYLQKMGFAEAELIGSLAKKGVSYNDIDIHIPNMNRDRMWELVNLFLHRGVTLQKTDWEGLFFSNTPFGNVDIFFSVEDFDSHFIKK